jgi:hypothetical protein
VTRKPLAVCGALAGAAAAGAVAAVAVLGGAPAPAAAPPPPVAVARVVRTTLAATMLTAGTVGYAPSGPVVNRIAGTYTQLPAAGARIGAGRALYRVDDLPVILMRGRIPAWRPFLLGMTSGPDVTQLEQNLIAFGDAAGLFSTAADQFTWATAAAVERWQSASGLPVTGQIEFGRVVFLPHRVRVGVLSAAPGAAAASGNVPYQATTSIRVVTVPIDPANAPNASVGERVGIVLPAGGTTPGTITAIGSPSAAAGQGGGPGPGAGAQAAAPSTVLTVKPEYPSRTGTGAGIVVQVSLTTQSVSGVLAAPVSALLALAGGGYGVEVVEPSGAHRLVGVRTGIFAGGQVEVTGPGIEAGTKVVVAR